MGLRSGEGGWELEACAGEGGLQGRGCGTGSGAAARGSGVLRGGLWSGGSKEDEKSEQGSGNIVLGGCGPEWAKRI